MSSDPPSQTRLERWAAFTPWIVLFYFAVQFGLRVAIGSPLEVDDAEMVGQIDWALGYPNSHPPLYHWLVRICYDLSHSWPVATALPKYGLLAAAYILVYQTAREATGSTVTAAVAVAFFFFIPVVCWKTQTKLTHSILGFAGTAAVLHAMVRLLNRPNWKAYTWLGLAATIGLLAKYNFLFVLLALAIPALFMRDIRRLFRVRTVVISLVISILLTLPHLLWVRAHPRMTTENLYRLQVTGGPLGLHLKADSVWDGVLSLFLVAVISAGPLFGMIAVATLMFGREKTVNEIDKKDAAEIMRRLLGWMLISELVIFMAVILAGGFSQVHERYLVVLLPPLPLWAALWWRADRRPKGAALVLDVAVVLAITISIATGFERVRHRAPPAVSERSQHQPTRCLFLRLRRAV